MKLKIKNPGRLVYQIRIQKNYSRNYIANELGTSVRTIGNWENGKSKMSIDQVNRVSEVLEIHPLDLIEVIEEN